MNPEWVSSLVLPFFTAAVGGILLFGRRKNYFDAFVSGAKEGLRTAVGLLPTLTALTVAISMLNASGLVAFLAELLAPLATPLGLPSELLPLLLTRPFSGGASLAAYGDLLSRLGADSFAGLCASVIYGSSDTLVYVITVYCSSVGIRRTRWAFP
jgi:spore maturation protein B